MKALMYGSGNIGRGFIGQLFYLSGYETTFVDINETIINKINNDKEYPIYITDGDNYKEEKVKNISCVDGKNIDAVAEAIAGADIMATAVGVNVLPYIIKPVAAGIKKRIGKAPLNIIICENMLGADKYLRELISKELNEEENKWFYENVGLVEASIGRMVPATPKEIFEKNPLSVCVEPFNMLPVDKAAFKGEIPYIVNLEPFTPFEFFIERKLFMHNMSHALMAYLGYFKGYTYIWECANDAEIVAVAKAALMESSKALNTEHGVPMSELEAFGNDLLERFKNKLLGDTVARVGADPKRKLSENDRFMGAIKLCKKHNLPFENIQKGYDAGYKFMEATEK